MRKVLLLLATLMLLASTARAEQLNLKDCLARAAATNRGLKAASYEVGIAQEQIQIAKSGLEAEPLVLSVGVVSSICLLTMPWIAI